jgi:hypothetical protein
MEYNIENYQGELKALEKEFELRKQNLIKLYAQENNPYKVGDTIRDHIGSIVIEKVSYTTQYGSGFPTCSYYGLELKKDLTPRKDGSKRWMAQFNIE